MQPPQTVTSAYGWTGGVQRVLCWVPTQCGLAGNGLFCITHNLSLKWSPNRPPLCFCSKWTLRERFQILVLNCQGLLFQLIPTYLRFHIYCMHRYMRTLSMHFCNSFKHMVGCVSNLEQRGDLAEQAEEGKSAAFDTESNPAISCTLSPALLRARLLW